MKKITVPTLKPRNPFVAAAHRRRAGVHRGSRSAQRLQMRLALRHELERLRHPSP